MFVFIVNLHLKMNSSYINAIICRRKELTSENYNDVKKLIETFLISIDRTKINNTHDILKIVSEQKVELIQLLQNLHYDNNKLLIFIITTFCDIFTIRDVASFVSVEQLELFANAKRCLSSDDVYVLSKVIKSRHFIEKMCCKCVL